MRSILNVIMNSAEQGEQQISVISDFGTKMARTEKDVVYHDFCGTEVTTIVKGPKEIHPRQAGKRRRVTVRFASHLARELEFHKAAFYHHISIGHTENAVLGVSVYGPGRKITDIVERAIIPSEDNPFQATLFHNFFIEAKPWCVLNITKDGRNQTTTGKLTPRVLLVGDAMFPLTDEVYEILINPKTDKDREDAASYIGNKITQRSIRNTNLLSMTKEKK